MRYLIISDIHGCPVHLEPLLNFYVENHFDYLIILGDILYHGPRNNVPEGYNPQKVTELLNAHASSIIACRGNCEAEVDQMLLTFPCLNDYSLIVDQKIRLFATHGHKYTADHFPNAGGQQVFLYGHTHLWDLRQEGDLIICNPGSITLPKENRPCTYAVYEEGHLGIFTLDHKCISELSF